MLFNSFRFLIFFPLVFLAYWGTPHRFRKYLLLVASYYFYMCWKPEFIVLILLSTAIDYLCGLGLGRTDDPKRRKVLLMVSLTMNLGLLFFFKYFNFFGGTLTALCRAVSIPFSAPMLDIILPVGISFYTFQTLSYTIDVYRGKLQPERDFVTFALFVSFFPQLVAGPIEKASNLLPQLKEEHTFSYDDAAYGLKLMVWGFFKKSVVAAYLGKLADLIYNDVRGYTGGALLVATVAFAIQIYCDFGGYSDIARGCARMMGVRLMENFKAPYLAASMTSFWRRWHISLTSWFREYVYIPLGGNRRGAVRKELNTVATFALSGLWHGASWTFVVWGLLNAGYLVVEDVFSRYCTVTADNGNSRYLKGLCQALGRLWTLCLACFAWIFFRANTMGDALYVAGHLFTGLSEGYLAAAYAAFLPYGWTTLALTVFSVAVLFAVDYVNERRDAIRMVSGWPGWLRWGGYVGFLVLLVLLIPKESAAPFIYFQF